MSEPSSIQQLKAAEIQVDEKARRLEILKLPIRVPLSQLAWLNFGLLHRVGTSPSSDANAKGESLLGRLSYLAPLLANCPEMPTGADANDVAIAYAEADPNAEQAKLLVSCARRLRN